MGTVQQNPAGVPAFLSGTLTQTNGTDVAANTEIAETVPAGEYWLLKAVSVSLVQGATQTPRPTLIVDDGTDIIFQGFGATTAQDADVTTRYTWAPGLTLTVGTANTIANAALPSGLVLGPGYRLRTLTGGIGANSNYAALSISYVRFARWSA